MKVVAVCSQKGGVGKTTLAVNLATEAASSTNLTTTVLDLDPQRSASLWARQRMQKDAAPTLRQVQVKACSRESLRAELSALRASGAKHVFIDLPPQSKKWMTRVFQVSDLVLLPLRPGFFDMISGFDTWSRVEDRPVRWVINGAFDAADAAESVSGTVRAELNRTMKCLETIILQAPEWAMSASVGMGVSEYAPQSAAAGQSQALWREVDAFPEILVKHRYG